MDALGGGTAMGEKCKRVPLSALAGGASPASIKPMSAEERVQYLRWVIERQKEQIGELEAQLEYKHLLVDRCLESLETNGRVM